MANWNMPQYGLELDPFETSIRADKRLANLPFVMVTAEGNKEHVIEATREGVTGFIVKPFTAKDLGKKLNLILPEE